ncbi:MAG: choice-of-anchor tandem repeat GloVer-containing protein [Verrucomicrobiota bacterium]
MKLTTLLTATLLGATCAHAQYTVLHTFYDNDTTNGAGVAGSLTGDADGTLYGMTTRGGLQNRGVIFSILTNGTGYTVLHDFGSIPNDGNAPRDNSLVLADGILYGATDSSLSNDQGVVFSIATNGANYQILHYFVYTGSDGLQPYGTLLVTGSSLIGVTHSGSFGPPNGSNGTIYKMDTNGLNYQVIHRFDGNSAAGGRTSGGLLLLNSTLYGLMAYGSTGAVYSVETDGNNFQVLATFADQFAFYERPLQLITDGTKLYGLTRSSTQTPFGEVFSIATNGANYQTVHAFPDVPLVPGGAKPSDTLSLDGTTIIGAAFGGGPNGAGTIFRVNTNGTGFETLISLNPLTGQGSQPYGGLVRLGSTYYSATQSGHQDVFPTPSDYNGVIFAFTPSTNTGSSIVCALTPLLATNTVGTTHTVTATVTSNTLARSGAVVSFSMTGANAGNKGTATTGIGGTASFTYTGTSAGTDAIRAISLGATGTATKVWIAAPLPDLTVDLAMNFGTCTNDPKSVLCPADATLTLFNDGNIYGAATVVVTNKCKPGVVPPSCKLAGTLTVTQFDLGNLPAHSLAFYLSTDTTFDVGDFRMAEFKLTKLAAALLKGKPVKLSLKLPKGVDFTGRRILAVVDSQDDISESNEANNTAASPALPALP